MNTPRRDMVAELGRINGILKAPVDIVTITGFMNDSEVLKHLERYRIMAADPAMAHI